VFNQRYSRSLPDPKARATLSVPETAAVLGVSAGCVYEACRRSELPSLKVRGRVIVPTAALVDMLSGGAV